MGSALVVTLNGRTGQNGSVALEKVTLSMDASADQARVAQWMASGQVRAVHSLEATLEEVFLEGAGVRPA